MVNKIIDKKQITTEKKVGIYKANFNTSFNEKDSDAINLIIVFSEDLRALIKEATINEKVKFPFNNGKAEQYKERYRVKSWVYNTLSSSNRELLFLNEL